MLPEVFGVAPDTPLVDAGIRAVGRPPALTRTPTPPAAAVVDLSGTAKMIILAGFEDARGGHGRTVAQADFAVEVYRTLSGTPTAWGTTGAFFCTSPTTTSPRTP